MVDKNGNGRSSTSTGLTTFDQAPRLLPDKLAQYVADRPIALDNQYDKHLAYALALVSGWSYAEHATVVRQLALRGIDADVTKIAYRTTRCSSCPRPISFAPSVDAWGSCPFAAPSRRI
jgi:hypothetical protein